VRQPRSPDQGDDSILDAGTTSIPLNKPFVAGKELFYIAQAITFGNL